MDNVWEFKETQSSSGNVWPSQLNERAAACRPWEATYATETELPRNTDGKGILRNMKHQVPYHIFYSFIFFYFPAISQPLMLKMKAWKERQK